MRSWYRGLCLLVLLLTPSAARSQSGLTGTIAGAVRDTSGALLPGVTVEAASPALIEKVRAVNTDAAGQFKIVDLRPGIYTVTFGLPGFSSIRREGLEITTGFTATLNVEMKVGAIEETVTVTGASPVVDTQNVRTQSVLAREVLDALPYSKTSNAYLNLMPNVQSTSSGLGSRDVGGTQGDNVIGYAAHGSDAGITSLDGIKLLTMTTANWRQYNVNPLYTQEVVIETGNGSAEAWSGGVNVNVVSKDGGNTFHGVFETDYTGKGLDTDNLTDELRARGLQNYNKQKKLYDIGGALGGPIQKDKLWFFATPRWWGNQYYIAGNYYNATPHTLFYTPDLSRPAIFERNQWDVSTRLTWQPGTTHKVGLYVGQNHECYCPIGPENNTVDPTGGWRYYYDPSQLVNVAYTHPIGNRLLVEGGFAWHNDGIREVPAEGVLPTDRPVTELSRAYRYGSNFSSGNFTLDYQTAPSSQWHYRGSLSYVTGSHSLKVGANVYTAFQIQGGNPLFPEMYNFNNQLPVSITQEASPNRIETHMGPVVGLYLQDQWTLRRLTLNLGARYDHVQASSPAQTRPAGEYIPSISFPEVDSIPRWNDVRPRLGAAYDVFGNGKTAVKASFGSYSMSDNFGLTFTRLNSPLGAVVPATTRTWNDNFYGPGDPRSGNFVPDCDLHLKGVNGECGALANQAFGSTAANTRYADDVKKGWGVSPYLWQGQVSVQQELAPNVALSAGYFRTWYGNIYAPDNVLVTPQDYTSYCFTAPTDARLPGGGGYPVCGLYDVSREKFGQISNLMELAPDRSNTFNGIDVLLNARLGKGRLISGGYSGGRQVIDNCATQDVPTQFCRQVKPWASFNSIKMQGVYPLPWWDVQTSLTYQNLPGLTRGAAPYAAPNAQVAPGLGRDLSSCPLVGACTATTTINLIEPFTNLEPRGNQVDLRVTKTFHLGGARLQGNFDVYNLTNSSDVLSVSPQFGPIYLRPASIMAGRLYKFSGRLVF